MKTPAANEDEARLADDSEEEVSVASVNEEGEAPVDSETSMAGEFTFGSALAEAAAASGSLITDAENADEVGFGAFGDSDGSLPLLLGAIGLAAVGLIFIVSDGSDDDDDVVPVNQPPTITAPDAVTTDEDSDGVALGAPTADDPDAGDTLTVTAASPDGDVTDNGDGSFSFEPAPDFNGEATVTYTVSDGTATATATQIVTVNPVNDPPVLTVPAIDAVDENSTEGVTFTPTATDVDGDTVTIGATVPAAQGTITDNGDGSFTFVPATNFDGVATVVVSANDGTVTTVQNADITVNDVGGPTVEDFSIDIGTQSVAVDKDAGTASFNFTDNAAATTNVNITNFTDDDAITVTGATASDYNFARSFEDINDLVITYTDPGTGASNVIVIQDILPDAGNASSLGAVNALLGFSVLSFA